MLMTRRDAINRARRRLDLLKQVEEDGMMADGDVEDARDAILEQLWDSGEEFGTSGEPLGGGEHSHPDGQPCRYAELESHSE